MAFPVTLNGRTYTLTDFEGTNYVDGLPDAFEDFVTHAGDIYNSTSTTSNSIGTGSKTFTVEANKPYQAGTPLRIADAAAPSTNFLDTVVTSYSGTTLVVNSIGFGGSGTKTSWTVNIGGAKTVDGTLGLSQGGTGATDAAGARTNIDVYSKADADSRFLNVSGEASDVTITGTLDAGTITADGLTVGATSYSSIGTSEAPTLSTDGHTGEALWLRSGGTSGSGNVQAVLGFGKADGGTARTGAAIASIQTDADADRVGLAFYRSGSSASVQTMAKSAEFLHNGDISFYEDTGTTAKFFWDAADERLGIGTSSPSSYGHSLVVAKDASGGATYATITNTNANQFLNLGINADVAEITWDNADSLAFGTTAASTDEGQTLEAMRIGSTGTLTIGKPAEDISTVGHAFAAGGYAFHTRDGNTPLFINRLTSDGVLAEFRKDNSTHGYISAVNGDIAVGTGNTSLRFYDGTSALLPAGTDGAQRSDAISLGDTNNRFNDLYLSGGVYLGGTGAANKLSSYEEGTWTPSVGGATTDPTVTYGTQQGFYVKIGRMVHISMYLNCTAVSGGAGAAKINGIPFNANNAGSYFGGSQMEIFGLNVPSNMNNVVLRINGNSGHFRLEFVNTQASSTGGSADGVATGDLANNFRVLGSFTYMTT